MFIQIVFCYNILFYVITYCFMLIDIAFCYNILFSVITYYVVAVVCVIIYYDTIICSFMCHLILFFVIISI